MGFSQPAGKEYVLSSEFHPWFRRRIRTRMLVVTAMMVVISMGFSFFTTPWNSEQVPPGIKYLEFLGPSVLLAIVWLLWLPSVIKKQIAAYESYKIIVDDKTLTRIQEDHIDIVLHRGDIRRIEERPESGMIVSGLSRAVKVWIPLHINDYAVLKSEISRFKPIERDERLDGFSGKIVSAAKTWAPLVLGMALVLVACLIGGMAGLEIFMVVYLPIGIFLIRRNPNVSGKVVKTMWTAWGIMLLSLIWDISRRYLLHI